MYPMGYYCSGLQNTLYFQHCHRTYYLSDFFKFHDLKIIYCPQKVCILFNSICMVKKKEDKKMRKKIPQPYGPEFRLDVCDTISQAEMKDA